MLSFSGSLKVLVALVVEVVVEQAPTAATMFTGRLRYISTKNIEIVQRNVMLHRQTSSMKSKKQNRTLMTERELDTVLEKVQMPKFPRSYSESFPTKVITRLRPNHHPKPRSKRK